MKKLALLTILPLLPIFAFAFSLTLNSGKESGVSYSILHLKDESEFSCKQELLAYDKKIYICEISSSSIPKIEDKILSLVDIKFTQDKNSTKITVTPHANSRLISYKSPLFGKSDVISSKDEFAKHHAILIDPALSEFDKTKKEGINFAPSFNDMRLPSVGALDLNKAPIENPDSHDINLYLDIKKDYDARRYEAVVAASETALRRYAQSIFASEFMLYRLRALDKILEKEESYNEILPIDITNQGKAWMRRFTSDENYSEVLYLVTKSYIKQDMMSDANYTLDILMNEHPDSTWTKMAILEFADKIYISGKTNDAIRMYENVLYSANSVDVASRAALSLTQTSINAAKFERAKEYILKILNANESYLLNDIASSMELAGVFHDRKMDDVASRIYEILVENSKKNDDHYEIALKNLALSLSNTNDVDKAYKYLRRYQNEFKDGGFIAQIETGLDRLFFELKENNATKLHEYYDVLMEKYPKNEIAQKALKEQVGLYLKEGKFSDVLRYTDAARDMNESEAISVVNEAALELAKISLREDNCKRVVSLVEGYGIDGSIDAKFKLFDCYMRLSRFESAYELARANMNAKDMLDRIEWLIKLSSALIKVEKYSEALRVADEALAIATKQEYADVSPVLFHRFEALLKLNRISDAAATISAIETLREDDFKVIETYDKMAEAARLNSDFVNSVIYAKKTIDLQNRLNIATFSPKINFTYIDSLNRLNRLDEAAKASKELVDSKLAPNDRARALAQISEIYIKRKQPSEAKPYINECVGLNFESSWKSICKEQLKLVE
ncbi:tetratricopeptide repeat protein [Campylobacter sp.]|uniref:tetratricopeptide repeat protein n=1 Tax=Campylobacter sp. TaxID=205 RepID=UPI0027019EBE|nr:hypothetical protein [Campylobacter sp.]